MPSRPFAGYMKVNKRIFSVPKSGLSFSVIKLSGILFWRPLCLVNSWSSKVPWILSREQACVKDLWLDQSVVLEQKTATIQTTAEEMSATRSGVSTSDPSVLQRTPRFTSDVNLFQAHQSVSVQSLQAEFCRRVLC